MNTFGLLEKRLEGAVFISMKQYRKGLKNQGNRDLPGSHEDSGDNTLPLPGRPILRGTGSKTVLLASVCSDCPKPHFQAVVSQRSTPN